MTGIRPSLIAASRRRVFNPLSLSPALWLSDTGSSAGTWPDLSGNGRDATQADSANQPAIITNELNGRQVRRFDGNNDRLTVAARGLLRNLAGATVFCVAKPAIQGGGERVIFASTASNGVHNFLLAQIGSSLRYGGRRLAADSGDFTNWGTFSQNEWRIVVAQQRWSAAEKEMWATVNQNNFDSSFQTSGNSENEDAAQNPAIGSLSASASLFFNGDIAEMLLLPYAPTTADRQRVELYLSQKYNIALV